MEDVCCTAGLGSGYIKTGVDSNGAITGTCLTLTEKGAEDTWYTASQEVSVDRKNGSFTLSSQKLHCAPASSDYSDYCDVSQICWKNGSIQHVQVPRLTQAKKS